MQVAQLAGLQPEITKGAQEAGKLLERKLQVALLHPSLTPHKSAGMPGIFKGVLEARWMPFMGKGYVDCR